MAGIHRIHPRRLILCAAALGAAACAQAAPDRPASRATPVYDPDTRKLERVTYDRNSDGRTDATTYMNGALVTHAELDENFDGTIDRREYFVARPSAAAGGAAAAPAPATVLDRVEVSTRADGRVTRRERYENGVLRHVEEDTDEDGRVDKWETWESGSLSMLAMDTLGRGRPDRRLVYPAGGGGEPRLEVDPDGTGTFARAAQAPGDQ